MIRIAIATAVVGGGLAAWSCLFTCSTSEAVAGTSTEVADASDSHCDKAKGTVVATAHAADKADCDKSNCDKADCDKSNCDRKAKATTVATSEAAPADGDDTPCNSSKPTSQVVLASTTRVVRVENATCGSCIVPIREQLTQLAGIADIQSGEDFKDVVVTLTQDSKVSDEQILAAVKKAGYTATIKAEAPKQEA